MLSYEELKIKPRKLLALTSLTPNEFEDLLPAFERAYLKAYPPSKTIAGQHRKRKSGTGRKGSLTSIEQKLLFALVYQKSYPLQSVLGELFGIEQSRANEWIHRLLSSLKQAVDDLDMMPERDPKKFKSKEKNRKDAVNSIIDGTERRRQRPRNPEKQALYYSGKKKTHSDKNVVIATAQRKRISYLSETYPGKTHDKKVADTVFMPLTVGGGIRTVEEMHALLLAGADKVSVNSAAVRQPELLSKGAARFGAQCIVLAIDARRNGPSWEVYINGGRVPARLDAVEWAVRGVQLGAGEILLTSMDTDGTLAGFDLELTRTIAEAVSVPVIASGGAGTISHFAEVLTEGKADAALAASLFHHGKLRVADVKRELGKRNIPVRIPTMES